MILSSDNVSTLATTAVDTTPASTGLQQVPPTLDPGKAKGHFFQKVVCIFQISQKMCRKLPGNEIQTYLEGGASICDWARYHK